MNGFCGVNKKLSLLFFVPKKTADLIRISPVQKLLKSEMLPMFQRQTALGSTHLLLLGSASHASGSEKPLRISNIPKWLEKWQFLVSSSLKKASKSQTARARACAEQNAYRPAWQLVRAVACAILYALGVTCARAMSPRVKQNGSHLSKKWMNILLTMLFILSLGDFEW